MKTLTLVFSLMNILLGIGAIKFEPAVGIILIITNTYSLTLGFIEMKQQWDGE